MKAIQYISADKIEVNEIDMVKVPKGWGLIKVSHAGICGTDLNIYAGTHPRAKPGLVMGHEFCGRMENDVGEFKKGDRVCVYPLISCKKCTPCREGNEHVCNTLGLFGIDANGGMSDYTAVPVENIIRLPDGVSDKMGAFIEPVAVAVHTLREYDYQAGDNALVFGCGTIGLCTALTLRSFGGSKIYMAETDQSRATLAESLGFEVVNPAEIDMNAFATEKTNGDGFDYVFDCAGVQPVADILLDMVKVRGKIIVVASYKKPCSMPFFKGMAKEAMIGFVRVYRKKDFNIAAEIMTGNKDFEKIITHVVDKNEAQKGFDLLLTKGTGAVKVMFKFD